MPADGMRTMKRTPGVSALGVLLSALLLLGGGGGGNSTSHPSDTKPVPPSTSPATTSPPTATTLPPGVSLTAQVTAPLAGVYDDPSSPQPSMSFGPSWHIDDDPSKPSVPEVFLVQEQRPGWVRVLLPTRPNGSSGWIHAGDVQVSADPYHMQVDVAAHQITVFNGTQVVYQDRWRALESETAFRGSRPRMPRISSSARALSSAGERCLHTAEVTGSKPVAPTMKVHVYKAGTRRSRLDTTQCRDGN